MSESLIDFLRRHLDSDEKLFQYWPGDRSTSTMCWDGQAGTTTSWNLERGLAEVAAKRMIIDQCNRTLEFEDYGHWLADGVLKLLALPYADRPGYQESWRP